MDKYEKYQAWINCCASTLILYVMLQIVFNPEMINVWWHKLLTP